MTYEEKRREQRAEERHRINTYAPLEALEQIAIHHFPALLAVGRATHGLDTLDSDDLDFFEVSVWGLKEALVEAYQLGHTKGYADRDREEPKTKTARLLRAAEECIGAIEDALDRGADNDWAREAIEKYERIKEEANR